MPSVEKNHFHFSTEKLGKNFFLGLISCLLLKKIIFIFQLKNWVKIFNNKKKLRRMPQFGKLVFIFSSKIIIANSVKTTKTIFVDITSVFIVMWSFFSFLEKNG